MTASPAAHVRHAAIDIGTNSVLLLVVEQRQGRLVAIVERAVITRLGSGVDRTRRLDPQAVARTIECLASYRKELDGLDVVSLDAVGTSALRDAAGSEDFIREATRALGVRPKVISGDREAQLTFQGAVSGLNLSGSATMFDVGGGSTEVVEGHYESAVAQVRRTTSVDIGAVRLFERAIEHDPPLDRELEALRNQTRHALPNAAPYRSTTVVGVAGTVTTLAAMAKQLVPYDGHRVHGTRLSRNDVESWLMRLSGMNLEERRAIPGLDRGRADVIIAGAAIVLEVIDWLGVADIIVSDRGLRWGLAEQAAAKALSSR